MPQPARRTAIAYAAAPDCRDRIHTLLRRPSNNRQPIRAELPEPRTDGTVAIMRLYDPIDSYGDIWGLSAKEFVTALDALDPSVTEIQLLINSPGGEVFEGIAILNALRAHKARVVTIVEGLAASAASVVAMAGDEVVMAPNAELMIHDAWGICVGNAGDMRAMADELDHFSNNLASVYATKAGGTVEEWRAAMSGETWYSAEEAVAAGLADRVDSGKQEQPKNRFDLSIFTYAGRAKAPAPKAGICRCGPRNTAAVDGAEHLDACPHKTPAATASGSTGTQEGSPAVAFSDEQLTTLRQRVGVADDADEATILAALDEALAERADPPTAPATPTVPEGMALVDTATLDTLRSQAAQGVEARVEQLRDRREQLVRAAVNDGRIAPARRDHWLAQLEQDPGAEGVLAALAPGLIPVEQRGTDAAPEALSDDDAFYASLFGERTGA